MEKPELTMEDLVTLVSAFEGEFIIDIECRKEDETDA